jgi:hypothetical protein
VRAWAALRPASVESRFEALHSSGLTELVGREEELELRLRRWSKAKSGEGQVVVLLSGEAGIGKSRLTAALLEQLAGRTSLYGRAWRVHTPIGLIAATVKVQTPRSAGRMTSTEMFRLFAPGGGLDPVTVATYSVGCGRPNRQARHFRVGRERQHREASFWRRAADEDNVALIGSGLKVRICRGETCSRIGGSAMAALGLASETGTN